jgi:hypothetical protein
VNQSNATPVIVEKKHVWSGFSLVSGGPVYRVLQWIGICESPYNIKRILTFLVLTWLPLAVLTLVDGAFWGSKVAIPLFSDFSIYGRFFLALPLLIAAETIIEPLIRQAAFSLGSSGIIGPDDLPVLHAIISTIVRWRDSVLVEVLLALLALLPYFLMFADYQWSSNRLLTWHGSTQGGLTLAGWWFVLVASPVVRFLMLQWLWRGALWSFLLWKISSLHLDLLPTHPDRLAGLGFLVHAQEQFGILSTALGSVLAGQFANEIVHFGKRVSAMTAPVGVFIALSVIVIVLPLTFFSRQLFKARHLGLVRYSVAGRRLTRKFDVKWIRGLGLAPESMLGTQDPSSLIDYISSYDVINKTRMVPITKHAVAYIAALAAVPFAFVWLLATPLERVVEEVVKRIL